MVARAFEKLGLILDACGRADDARAQLDVAEATAVMMRYGRFLEQFGDDDARARHRDVVAAFNDLEKRGAIEVPAR